MHIADILGFLSAMVIGFTLGLLGGGGSVLTMPALVYIVGIEPVLATAYSLFIVGCSSLAGALRYRHRGLLHYKAAFVFSLPSLLAVFVSRKFVLPAVPELLWQAGDMAVTKSMALMVLFALLMLGASVSMIMPARRPTAPADCAGATEGAGTYNYPMIMLEGTLVGLLTGLVGAGGGFLIIPALVLLARLPMKTAVGTSLLIIAAKSLVGFLGDVGEQPIDWWFLCLFTLFSIAGIMLGTLVSQYIAGEKLKAGFGWLVLCMGIYIIIRELLS